MSSSFRGVYVAMVTPMTSQEEIDCSAVPRLVEQLIESGVGGLIPLGSTGEYYALSADERKQVLEATIQAVDGRVPVVAGANAASTREVIAHCREAEQLGADGVLLAAPYYSLPTPDELVEHFSLVDRAISVPIMLYNYPARTGVDMTPDVVGRLAELPNVRYIKESSGDVTRVSEIVRRFGQRITVFCGCDTLALESFVLGAAGWVGGVANVLPAEHVALYQAAVEKGDFVLAKDLYYRLLPVLALMEGGGKYTQYVKAARGLVAEPVGPPRRPLAPPTESEMAAIAEAVLRGRATSTAQSTPP